MDFHFWSLNKTAGKVKPDTKMNNQVQKGRHNSDNNTPKKSTFAPSRITLREQRERYGKTELFVNSFIEDDEGDTSMLVSV